MRLHFHGPYQLCSEKSDVLHGCPYAKSAGIYLWAVPAESSGFVVDYVGETSTSFYARNKEHVIQTLGGNYLVLEAKALAHLHATVLWTGLWRRGTRDQMPRFLADYETLGPRIKEYLLLHQVFVAPIECERRLRRRIEGALALSFRSLAPCLLPEDVRYHARAPWETPLRVTVSSDAAVVGLPRELDA
jgi:hypothetical protein